MREICSTHTCTGCSLCAFVCSKKSISMQPIDNLGHLYPIIDQNTCVDCGLCKKVCPSIHPLPKQRPLECFAAWSKDIEDYKSSTSGGVASVLSQYIINKGGVVYGCAMLPDVIVKHIRVDKIEDLYRLKGSKYAQSDISEVIPLIKKDIKEGKEVLFTGTPCQCAAVRNIFKEQPENLYLVDLICHGVPSLKLLQNHITKVFGSTNIEKVIFRDAKGQYEIALLNGEKVLYQKYLNNSRYNDFYINSFFDGYTFRNSCYLCQYAKPERAFDITIGDFWGLGKKTPATEIPEHPNGCSVILPVSIKGVELTQSVRYLLNMYPRDVAEAVKGNEQLRVSFKQNRRIKVFRWIARCLGLNVYRWIVMDKIIIMKLVKVKQILLSKK